MTRRSISTRELATKLSAMPVSDVAALSGISSLDTTTDEFGEVFKENPAAALATKGIVITEQEANKIRATLGGLRGGPGQLASTEIGVSVKHKF